MKTYKVKSNLKHNKKLYEKGSTIELEENVALPLVRDGVLVDTSADVEDDEPVAPQPPVNEVKREGDDVEGTPSVEPGKVEGPQPGDDADGEGEGEGAEGDADGEGNDGEGDNL